MFKVIKKADLLLLALFVLSGLIPFILNSVEQTKKLSAYNVVITVNGADYGTYDLLQDQVIDIDPEGTDNHNELVIQNGSVYMNNASCHNQVCVDQGTISRVNEQIICLPNRVVVTIVGTAAAPEFDAVSK